MTFEVGEPVWIGVRQEDLWLCAKSVSPQLSRGYIISGPRFRYNQTDNQDNRTQIVEVVDIERLKDFFSRKSLIDSYAGQKGTIYISPRWLIKMNDLERIAFSGIEDG